MSRAIMSRAIVAFGEDWGGLPSSTQHILGRVARERDILWVNSLGMRRPRLDRRDFSRVVAKLGAALGRRPPAGPKPAKPERLTVVNPRAVSWPGSRAANLANRFLLGRQLRDAVAQNSSGAPIFWTSLPTAAPLIGAFPHGPVVYYCGDDFSALAGVDHAPVARLERELVARADLILVASEALAERFPAARTRLIPHGVDFDLFSKDTAPAADLPRNGPVAGFYGSLADWIDVEMLAQCARTMPEWTFVLIGDVQTDISPLSGLANVQLLGPRPHKSLPSYSQHWTVSLLPFRDTPQIQACNPLKLREYLAAGTPVASMDFPALAPYRDLVSHTSDPSAFAETIRRAAEDAANAPARRARVAAESWDACAAQVEALLETL